MAKRDLPGLGHSDFGFVSDFDIRISDFPKGFGYRISRRASDFEFVFGGPVHETLAACRLRNFGDGDRGACPERGWAVAEAVRHIDGPENEGARRGSAPAGGD